MPNNPGSLRAWLYQMLEPSVWPDRGLSPVNKAVVADGGGTHVDAFQRLSVDPCSVSIVRYTEARPFVVRINDAGSDVGFLASKDAEVSTDAPVGGGAGRG